MDCSLISNIDEIDGIMKYCKLYSKFDIHHGTIAKLEEMVMNNDIVIFYVRDIESNCILGVLLSYSHYSTWVGEFLVIRHVIIKGYDNSVAQLLFSSIINYGKEKGFKRIDVFTSDETIKNILSKMNFFNLSEKEQWECFSLTTNKRHLTK